MEDKDVIEVTMVDYQASGFGKVTVTKKVTFANGGDFVDLIAQDDTFYVNLFTDAAGNILDLDVFEYAVNHSENPLCYNGDIVTKEDYDNITTRFPDVDAVMIGRGLLRNPALVREIKYGQKLTKKELLKMHDTLYEAYQDYLSGDKNVLYKMKEFWNNAAVMFTNHEKYAKKIRKVQTLKNYEQAVNALFNDQELIK